LPGWGTGTGSAQSHRDVARRSRSGKIAAHDTAGDPIAGWIPVTRAQRRLPDRADEERRGAT